MLKNGWFHAHNQNFDAQNEAHKKIDQHADNQLNLYIFYEIEVTTKENTR